MAALTGWVGLTLGSHASPEHGGHGLVVVNSVNSFAKQFGDAEDGDLVLDGGESISTRDGVADVDLRDGAVSDTLHRHADQYRVSRGDHDVSRAVLGDQAGRLADRAGG